MIFGVWCRIWCNSVLGSHYLCKTFFKKRNRVKTTHFPIYTRSISIVTSFFFYYYYYLRPGQRSALRSRTFPLTTSGVLWVLVFTRRYHSPTATWKSGCLCTHCAVVSTKFSLMMTPLQNPLDPLLRSKALNMTEMQWEQTTTEGIHANVDVRCKVLYLPGTFFSAAVQSFIIRAYVAGLPAVPLTQTGHLPTWEFHWGKVKHCIKTGIQGIKKAANMTMKYNIMSALLL